MSVNSEENIILVGGKPFMNYVTGVIIQFTTKEANEVVVKSRGKFISKAVDVAEVARRKFLVELKVFIKDVKISSEEFERECGKNVSVSTLEITMAKG